MDQKYRGRANPPPSCSLYSGATPDRTTTYAYLTGSNYLSNQRNIANRPTSVIVTDSGASTVSKILYCYDTSTTSCSTGATLVTSGATSVENHDDTDFGSGFTYRGNLTEVQRLVSGSSTYVTKSMTYDITGQKRTETDWLNNISNPTTYSYADNMFTDGGNSSAPSSYTPSTGTNAYLYTITHPTVNSVTLIDTFGSYWGIGQKALHEDPNGSTATTYYHFYDSMNRPTLTQLPPVNNGSNKGWNYFVYSSGIVPPADTGIGITSTTFSVTCTGTSGGCRHDHNSYDTSGRVTSKILESDPDEATTVDTSYDSNRRISCVSNPHRSGSLPTDGTTCYSYDGLDRKIQITQPDSTAVSAYFGAPAGSSGGLSSQQCSSSTFGIGYPVLSVDEAGNKRQAWTDGFGRLIEADEPNSSGSLSSGVKTCYAYDLNDNLIGVLQPGSESTCTVNSVTYNRCFSYDLLSRLTAAPNPESGTISYSYTISGSPCSGDLSNVCTRTDARGKTTTYSYDALNRLTSKSYSDSTPGVLYGYDAVAPTGCTLPTLTITNGKGRRTGMCDGSGQTAWSYDAVGNMMTEVRTITSVSPSVTETISGTYNLDNSTWTLTYPSTRQITYTTGNAQRTTTAYDSSNNYALGPTSCPSGNAWACYAPQGALSTLQNGASLLTNSFYNNRLQPCRIAVNSSTTTAPTTCTDNGHSGDKFDIQYSFDLSSMNSVCSTSFGSSTDNGNVASITNNVSSMSGVNAGAKIGRVTP